MAAFNDGYERFDDPFSLEGYAVSHDGGVTWTDMGAVAKTLTVQPASDPGLAVDKSGSVWLAAVALKAPGAPGTPGFSELGFWEMRAGSDTFRLVSTPVVAPVAQHGYFEDHPDLAVGVDG